MKINKVIFFTILLFTLLCLKHTFAADISQLTVQAKLGDTDAQYYLGKLYYKGEDIEQNYAKAFYWIKKSALGTADDDENSFKIVDAKGDADAQFLLGKMYALGEGVDGSYDLATQWLVKAANSGSTDKQYDLAELYVSGQLIPQDITQAFYWHNRAAEGGDRDSQYTIATMLRDGIGTEKNNKSALKWFLLAAKQGKTSAFYPLATIYRHGISVEKDLDKSLFWHNKASEAGNEDAKNELEYLKNEMASPSSNNEISKNNSEEYIALEDMSEDQYELMIAIKAAEQGDAEAQYKLGVIYAQSTEVDQDLVAAYKWLSLAANQGVIEALKLKITIMQQLTVEDLLKAHKEVKKFQISDKEAVQAK